MSEHDRTLLEWLAFDIEEYGLAKQEAYQQSRRDYAESIGRPVVQQRTRNEEPK